MKSQCSRCNKYLGEGNFHHCYGERMSYEVHILGDAVVCHGCWDIKILKDVEIAESQFL